MIKKELRDELFGDTDPSLLAKFKAFHQENKFVYEKFCEHARAVKSAGHKKYSAWTIINVIRWEEDIRTTSGNAFQINNDFIALYARLMIYYDESFKGFFELRSMKPEKRKISREEDLRNKK